MAQTAGATAAGYDGATTVQLQEVAASIYEEALHRARPVVLAYQKPASSDELSRDPQFLRRLKVGLAEGVARVLAANDKRVQAVYVFEESSPRSEHAAGLEPLDATVHLLILVQARSAALDALASALDEALTGAVRTLPVGLPGGQASLLNPIFITREDVAGRQGYAVLLSAASTTLLPVWSRDAR